jgi:vacuolar-type H+-ATPase subunit I/STV1
MRAILFPLLEYKKLPMSLEPKDIELLECIIYKNADDIAISLSRSFERLEERVDALESRLYSRMSELEDRIESTRQDLSDSIGNVREEVRDFIRMKEEALETD